ncbi:MAG: Ig-like domain-containing protein, partial [Planctomycetes bacterium]|nr:Ig-like domain-containing protein [Planctomycetota bacterium]
MKYISLAAFTVVIAVALACGSKGNSINLPAPVSRTIDGSVLSSPMINSGEYEVWEKQNNNYLEKGVVKVAVIADGDPAYTVNASNNGTSYIIDLARVQGSTKIPVLSTIILSGAESSLGKVSTTKANRKKAESQRQQNMVTTYLTRKLEASGTPITAESLNNLITETFITSVLSIEDIVMKNGVITTVDGAGVVFKDPAVRAIITQMTIATSAMLSMSNVGATSANTEFAAFMSSIVNSTSITQLTTASVVSQLTSLIDKAITSGSPIIFAETMAKMDQITYAALGGAEIFSTDTVNIFLTSKLTSTATFASTVLAIETMAATRTNAILPNTYVAAMAADTGISSATLQIAADTIIASSTVPTVSLTTPANNATGVALNANPTAVFSEAMDPLTITKTTFTLIGPESTPVDGAVTYVGSTATFDPTEYLTVNTTYTATISTGAKNIAKNALVSDVVWTFTTGTETIVLDPIALGQTSRFAVLAGYAITNVPASAITGDVGISPAAESFITGFSQTDATGYATSPQVTGSIYAADMASPTPAMLALAKGDLTTAYNDAVGRTPVPTGVFLNPGVGNLAGMNLVPGLYKFTGQATATTDFTLTGSANDVWIFQIATSLTISNGVKVTLSGGAKAENIFWQVGSQATLGTTVVFHGTIMANASITMRTGAILNGRALALSGTIALDQNTITISDTTPPTVSSVNPVNLSTNESINKKIAATFSEPMAPTTITDLTFTLTGPGNSPVEGTVTYVGTTATFSPLSPLAVDTQYTVTINTGVKDLGGNALAGNKVWTFTTGAAPDATAPTVSSTIPANSATGVALNSKPFTVFSEVMDPLTITNVTFTLTGPGVTPVEGAVTYVGTSATFSPTSSLTANTLYTATITTGAKDLASNALASNKVWTFTTGAAPDLTAPTVSSTIPANSSTAVSLNNKPFAIFSEAMDPLTITNVTFTLTGPGSSPVEGTVTYVGTTATFSPSSSLAANTVYTATITTGAKDLAGNAKASNKVWTFTTGTAPDLTAPTVSSTIPANSATGVSLNSKPVAVFSEAMDPLTITNV